MTRASSSTSPQVSRTHRSKPSRVVQNDLAAAVAVVETDPDFDPDRGDDILKDVEEAEAVVAS